MVPSITASHEGFADERIEKGREAGIATSGGYARLQLEEPIGQTDHLCRDARPQRAALPTRGPEELARAGL